MRRGSALIEQAVEQGVKRTTATDALAALVAAGTLERTIVARPTPYLPPSRSLT